MFAWVCIWFFFFPAFACFRQRTLLFFVHHTCLCLIVLASFAWYTDCCFLLWWEGMGTATTTKVTKAFALQTSCNGSCLCRTYVRDSRDEPRRPGSLKRPPGNLGGLGPQSISSSSPILSATLNFSLMREMFCRICWRSVSVLFLMKLGMLWSTVFEAPVTY